jgi:hypothetical protein
VAVETGTGVRVGVGVGVAAEDVCAPKSIRTHVKTGRNLMGMLIAYLLAAQARSA